MICAWVGGLGAATLARTDSKVYGPCGTRLMTDGLFGRDGGFKTDLRGTRIVRRKMPPTSPPAQGFDIS